MAMNCGRESTELADRAVKVLRGNQAGTMTRAAPDLYPHQWSWDAAFVAVGLAHVDVPRACSELDSLFAGQWSTGMLPHIVFDPHESGYFPGPDRWACADLTDDAPARPLTSGICQPPVHALAVERIADIAATSSGSAARRVQSWLPAMYDRLLAWHRYLARERDPESSGLLAIYHGWESGMDNSPRWDQAYNRIVVGKAMPAYVRRDTHVVADASQRPTSAEYDRYLWIVERLKQARYYDPNVRRTAEFLVTDVFASAVFAVANDALAGLARRLGRPDEGELRELARRSRRGVAAAVDPHSGLAADTDLLTGESLTTETFAGFAPLISGGLDAAEDRRLLALLRSPRWTGHPGLRHPVLPTVSPSSPEFLARAYWRGPSWPVMNWFVAWMLARRGIDDVASSLRRAALAELAEGSFAEYYDPMTGEPLGSSEQSWSAAAALDLVLAPEWSGARG